MSGFQLCRHDSQLKDTASAQFTNFDEVLPTISGKLQKGVGFTLISSKLKGYDFILIRIPFSFMTLKTSCITNVRNFIEIMAPIMFTFPFSLLILINGTTKILFVLNIWEFKMLTMNSLLLSYLNTSFFFF